MNLKKILTCAVALSIMAGSFDVVLAASDSNSTRDTTEQRLTHRKIISPSKDADKYERLRFIKLTSDDTYDYYLDRESVKWKRVPYTSSEYMADVWIRMIEKTQLGEPKDYAEDISEIAELAYAREQNINYVPSDVEVLMHKRYFLEHYYLRPQRKQIQFLCELEVVGHPSNNEAGRPYDVRNWEELIPGSIESIIYKKVLKTIGDAMAYEQGHMTFADYFEEYTRISIR